MERSGCDFRDGIRGLFGCQLQVVAAAGVLLLVADAADVMV
jgi:hypothetical protein